MRLGLNRGGALPLDEGSGPGGGGAGGNDGDGVQHGADAGGQRLGAGVVTTAHGQLLGIRIGDRFVESASRVACPRRRPFGYVRKPDPRRIVESR